MHKSVVWVKIQINVCDRHFVVGWFFVHAIIPLFGMGTIVKLNLVPWLSHHVAYAVFPS